MLCAAWKGCRVCAHLLHGLAQIVLLFPRLARPERERRVEKWAQGMLERLGVELRVLGEPVRSGPLLLVSNHISWLDILVLHAAHFCRFVSKANVRHWPLIGTLATGAGTLYVERESRRDALRVVHRMVEALKDGDIVAVFPEGTTGDGTGVLPFHANLLQAAVSADAAVQPVAIQFLEGPQRQPSRAVPYIGDDSLVGSIWRTLCAEELRAVVTFGAPQRAHGRERRAWARELREAVIALRPPSGAPT